MNNLTLTKMTPTDWQLLQKLRVRAAELHPFYFSDSKESAENLPESHWRALLSGTGHQFWVLKDGPKPVGITGVWGIDRETGIVGYSFIEPEYRGHGIAKQFYEVRFEHAKQHLPWKKLVTDHHIKNETSKKSILKNGFKYTHKKLVDWPDGSQDYECYYELDLAEIR